MLALISSFRIILSDNEGTRKYQTQEKTNMEQTKIWKIFLEVW
jgi:hypothetical protein